ncbi:Rieske (2Fe-2S) protein [Williamsia serinedens]|uniref:Cytochrome bc1 complex Rieske iron-sulfur subunit n=1 Tax=Williamsia serinedens TaxID=391736 RepID=A0ABT1GYP4_9NOCA|nr:Rieske (2Fe-2S) protein [Williamsia serinedens]MCP2160112.1 Ferredoxin subunit of nitrite reductase or a ring-hydroxylating dioxygenase [Williamsia serinedens]
MNLESVGRRSVLVGGAAGVCACALAACSSGGGSTSTSAAPSTNADGSLTELSAVPVGSSVAVGLPGGAQGIVTRTGETTARAFSAICPHQGCAVAPNDGKLVCPCHGSEFAPDTGAVLEGPSKTGLSTVAVSVRDGKVYPA